MFQQTRHFAPAIQNWDPADAIAAIAEIIEDAEATVDGSTLWPAHPMDGGPDGNGSIYYGAAGVIWALDYLRRVRGLPGGRDLTQLPAVALQRNAAWFASTQRSGHASLLMGDLGILLVKQRVAPEPGLSDAIHALAASNSDLPIVELMWGLPGSMLACLHMHRMTAEPRFRALFESQAARLLGDLEQDGDAPIWTQDLYGTRQRWLGPVHGFAGNMLPLIHGWTWLTDAQRAVIADAVPRTLAAHASRSELGASWPAIVPSSAATQLCQHCHGAPGMVTTFADAPFSTPDFESLLLRGGELTWNAGPLVKGSNLCHGTGGNGYAFLKLYRRTGNALWLQRARTFAMMAITQVRGARAAFGRGRYSVWTGDVGLAIYLWDCVTGKPAFPTIDIF